MMKIVILKDIQRILLTLISGISCIIVVAQTTQSGIVQEYNEKAKKTPLSGVEMQVSMAPSTVSDNQGMFDLKFHTLKPGEYVNVNRIEKLGYEIFNKEAVEQWNINPDRPFLIVMCRADKFKKIRDNYERISSQSYASQMQKEKAEIDKLKEEGKLKESEYNQKLKEIQENYYRQIDNLNNYIDRFSRIDLSEISDTEQDILDLVQHGHINEAIDRYEDLDIKSELIGQINNRTTIQDAIQKLEATKIKQSQQIDSLYDIYQRQIDTYMLIGGYENLKKIGCLYHEIALIDKTNTYWLLKGGYFIKNYLADYPLALELYQLALEGIKEKQVANPVQESILYNNIGTVYDISGEIDKALDYYQKALEILKTDDIFESNQVASIYNNIGSIYNSRGDFNVALDYYGKALAINESLLGVENPTIADSYNNVGAVYVSIGDYDRAKEYYDKALSIRKNIHNVPHPDIANSYNNIGHLYNTLGNMLKAWEYYCKALDIYQKTYGDNHPLVAAVYNNIGSIYCSLLKEYDTALEYHIKSKEIFESVLGLENLDLAVTYVNIGFDYYNLQDYYKSLEFYEKAFHIYSKLLPENHPTFIEINDKIDSAKQKINRNCE